MIPAIICAGCGKTTPKLGNFHRYCRQCSEERSRQRARKWAAMHPPTAETVKNRRARTISRTKSQGLEISKASQGSIVDVVRDIELEWLVRIAIPFDWAVSKNHVYSLRGHHISLREGARTYRELIGHKIKQALAGRIVSTNKVWLDLLVQKPSHRGDAVNVVDTVCDGLKTAIGIDDRWFAIRRLDWEIAKHDPQIFIGIGQENVEDAQVCSSCGRILPLASFARNAHTKRGVTRNCRDCRRKAPSS